MLLHGIWAAGSKLQSLDEMCNQTDEQHTSECCIYSIWPSIRTTKTTIVSSTKVLSI